MGPDTLAGPRRTMASMSETTTEQAAPSANGTAPTPAAEAPCEDCATNSEKGMAILAGLFGAFIILMAIDMFTGGRISGAITERAAGE